MTDFSRITTAADLLGFLADDISAQAWAARTQTDFRGGTSDIPDRVREAMNRIKACGTLAGIDEEIARQDVALSKPARAPASEREKGLHLSRDTGLGEIDARHATLHTAMRAAALRLKENFAAHLTALGIPQPGPTQALSEIALPGGQLGDMAALARATAAALKAQLAAT